jgi:hypothetical protein
MATPAQTLPVCRMCGNRHTKEIRARFQVSPEIRKAMGSVRAYRCDCNDTIFLICKHGLTAAHRRSQ